MSAELDALKAELDAVAGRMKAMHLLMAKALTEGKTQEEAYIAAKGKGKDPRKLASQLILTNPDIEKYVELAKKIAYEASLPKQIATLGQKRAMLWEIAQRCVQEVEPVYEGFGEERELVGYTFNAKGATGAIAELNKMDGHLAAIKTDNTTKTTVTFDLDLGGD